MEIYRLYSEERPRPGPELESFVQRQSEYFVLPEAQIRRMAADAACIRDAEVRQALSGAQQAAVIQQLRHSDVIAGIQELMGACRETPVMDKEGQPFLVNGQPLIIKTPHYPARSRGLELAAKILGSNAPKQVHIEARHEHFTDATDAEVERKLARIVSGLGFRLESIEAEYSVEPAPTAGGSAPTGAGPGGKGRRFLVEQPDGDD